MLAFSFRTVLLELHFGLQKAKAILFALSGNSWPQAGDPNLPTSEGCFHFTLLEKRKGERGGWGKTGGWNFWK